MGRVATLRRNQQLPPLTQQHSWNLPTTGSAGFPPLPLMEDSAFIWAARARGRVAVATSCVRTSAGGWASLGLVFMMRNYLLLSAWIVGVVTPATLHKVYYPGRPLPMEVAYALVKSTSTPRARARGLGLGERER